MTCKSKHCLREAIIILRVTEPQVILFLASWRKAVVSDSGVARDTRDHVGRLVCGEVASSDGIGRYHNENSGQERKHSNNDTPRLGRCALNVETFREIVGVVRPGVQYVQKLQAEHQLAWLKVGGARHLARRLLH